MNNSANSNSDFWHGKRCLITGADGFLATHLADKLVKSGALVWGTVRNRTRLLSRLDLFKLRDRISLFYCDIRDFRTLFDILAAEHIDTVFHLAATSIVMVASRTPLATLESNILGTANILEACRQTDVQRVVVAASDKAYGDHRSSLPYTEKHALRGLHVYDCSKSCADLITQTYFFQFGLPARVTRLCNIYGPGDLNFSRLIPGSITRLLDKKAPVIHEGQGPMKREYIHVADAAEAYLQIAKSIDLSDRQNIPSTGEEAYAYCAYNVGSGEAGIKTTSDMIETIQNFMGKHFEPTVIPKQRKRYDYLELPDQFLDSSKVREETGWEPRVALEDGLLETISWYQTHRDTLRPLFEAEIRRQEEEQIIRQAAVGA